MHFRAINSSLYAECMPQLLINHDWAYSPSSFSIYYSEEGVDALNPAVLAIQSEAAKVSMASYSDIRKR